MAITLAADPEQEAKLRSVAGQLEVSPEALAERLPVEPEGGAS